MGEALNLKRIRIAVIAVIAAVALGCSLSFGAQSAFAVGTTVDAGSGATAAKYTVTRLDPNEFDYTKTKVTGKNKTIKAAKTIKYGGKTYKVTSIAKNACKDSKAKKIVVCDNVKIIGRGAFRDMPYLKSLTIGKGVTKLGKYMVKNSKKLTTVTIKSKKLTKANVKGCFKGSKVKTVKVPKSKVKAYKKIFTKKNCGRSVTVKAI